MASQQQIDANRKNAQKSTGPKNPEGKAAVCRNAFSHGLTADLVCINGEDMNAFDATRQSFEDELKPVGPLQTFLVEQIVSAAWPFSTCATSAAPTPSPSWAATKPASSAPSTAPSTSYSASSPVPKTRMPNKAKSPRNPSRNRTLRHPPKPLPAPPWTGL